MPLLFSLGQHRALVAVQAQLKEGERLFAFFDDIYVVCSSARVGEVYAILDKALREKTGINIHQGKTKLWNKAGIKPSMTDALTCAAQAGGSRRSCVERRLGFAAEPAGPQGSWSAHRPPVVHHRVTWQRSSRNRRCSWNEFPSLWTWKSGGCCSFSAQPREQIVGSEQFHHEHSFRVRGTTRSECVTVPQQHLADGMGCLRIHIRQRPCL